MAKHRKTARAKVNIPICLAGILLCLTMFSFHFSSGVVARYSTSTSASDSARVISFSTIRLEVAPEDTLGTKQYIYPGAQLKYNPTVSFDGSEAETYVFVTVSGVFSAGGTGITPFGIDETAYSSEWTIRAEDWTWLKTEGNTHIYYYQGQKLEPNEKINGVALFDRTDDNDVSVVSTSLLAEDLLSVSAVSPEFHAYAVQGNGFATPDAAWTSLKGNLT